MKGSPCREIYRLLLSAHPRSFRDEFASEMLAAYDAGAAIYGETWLLQDAAISLLRQHLLRRPAPELPPAACAAVGLRSGVYPLVGPYEFLVSKLLLASLLSSILFQVI